MCCGIAYFFFIGLNIFELHFLHLILPAITFRVGALTFDLHFLHTNTFLKSLCSASGNLTISNTSGGADGKAQKYLIFVDLPF